MPTVRLWVDEHYPYVEVFTGDTVPEEHQRRRGLGVEPMTCPPDAFRTGEDVIRLKPARGVTTRWGIVPSLEAAGQNRGPTAIAS